MGAVGIGSEGRYCRQVCLTIDKGVPVGKKGMREGMKE